MSRQKSRLQKILAEQKFDLPSILSDVHKIYFQDKETTTCVGNEQELNSLFPKTFGRSIVIGKKSEEKQKEPLKVGVVFSGGQAAGGHNVIVGLFDALMSLSSQSKLLGFLGGPSGIIENKIMEITHEKIAPYRNQGGFDLIGSGRTKIETDEQLKASLETAKTLNLDGIVIIGGDDSNTNAAVLAEYFLKNECKTTVVGVPKTIDGDLKNSWVATSFGFDTATKTYAEMIGNIERDALSAKKYYHFIKLMGRSASHVTLECALATHPNIALIGEEIAAKKQTLADVTQFLVDVIEKRAKEGKNYGVILIPEGLIEFIFEMKQLIKELNTIVAEKTDVPIDTISEKLSKEAKHCFSSLPEEIQKQLLLDRDPHGNVQVSMIETEKLLINSVKKELKKRDFKGKFSSQAHFFGYEGRSGYPSYFDACYCQTLGYVAALLVNERLTGYMAGAGSLHRPPVEWSIFGLPITMLMTIEMRKGKEKPVIEKALVDLKGKAFQFFEENRSSWAMEDQYRYPGPIQFFGDTEMVSAVPITMQLEFA